MRIDRLSIEGFGPFASRQDIDFGALEEAGLFLITGQTGSGKSSILDAICFALYGRAPRYDGNELRVRSDHVDVGAPTRVELVFRAAGSTWMVTRSPEYERPKKRGDGTTVQKEEASLARLVDDEWVGLAGRAVDVADLLAPVLQLTREQFLQVILLAQGRFQEFLRAKNDDRIALLRALFGTERFERFESELAARARALSDVVGVASRSLDGDVTRLAELTGEEAPDGAGAAWGASVADRAGTAAVAAEAAVADAQAVLQQADRAAAQAVAIAGLQRRRDEARAAVARLDAERPDVERAARRRDDAVRVLPVLPELDRAARARRDDSAAVGALESAAAALPAPEADPAGSAERVRSVLGSLEAPLTEEGALPALLAAADRADAAVEAAREALLEAERIAATVPQRRAAVRERRGEAADVAATEQERTAALDRAGAAAAAARRAGQLRAGADAAAVALLSAHDAERHAGEQVRALIARRSASAAGVLAATLRDGEPCAVCGSVEHPAPAPHADAVDDETVERAQAVQDSAIAARSRATDRDSAARSAAAVAVAESGGLDVEQAVAAVDEARSRLAAARSARAAVEQADRELAGLDREEAASAATIETARTAVGTRSEAATATRTAATASAARVTEARADAPTVAARADALRGRLRLLRRLADATAAAATARATLEDAERSAAAALAAAELPDEETARAAALPTAERRALEERLQRHTDARAAANAQLADPDVASAPAEPADVAGTAAAKDVAFQARSAAGDLRSTAVDCARRAAALAEQVRLADEALGSDRANLAVLAPLAAVIRGDGANDRRMRLESYVLAARLEQIVVAANARLTLMTDGRFSLQHDDSIGYRNVRSGLGLVVLDEYTGSVRPTASLSGGETFLASLALALGLAEVVSAEAGGVHLDTLFVDEGFGSLDRKTLDTAMETLDSLRAGGRTVGLISHVEAMQEDIPAGLHVERLDDGSSAVRSRIPAAV